MTAPTPEAPFLLPSLRNTHVVVVGDVMLDRYWHGEAQRVSQEAPVPVVDVVRAADRPGGAANTALNVAAMGAQCTLIGVLGDDAEADTLESTLGAAGVNCRFVRVPGHATPVKLRIVSQRQQLIRADFDRRIDATHTAMTSSRVCEALNHELRDAAVVVLQDYDKDTLVDPALVLRLARDADVPVVVDPKNKPFARYAGASVVKPNINEFRHAVGAWQSDRELVTRAQQLLTELDFGGLVITRGGDGMTVVVNDGSASHLPARTVEVFDVTGAGDTAAAALAIVTALGQSLEIAARVANVAGSLAVAKSGTAVVTGPELNHALGLHSGSAGMMSAEQARNAVLAAREAGQRVVFTNGCFDILHAGHVAYLQEAKALGDRLLVAVNDDASVTRLKGAGRPVNGLERRMRVLAGLSSVDWVVPFSTDTPEPLLEQLQPDLLVKGGDYSDDQVVGADIVRAYGGDVKVLRLVADVSTTAILGALNRGSE